MSGFGNLLNNPALLPMSGGAPPKKHKGKTSKGTPYFAGTGPYGMGVAHPGGAPAAPANPAAGGVFEDSLTGRAHRQAVNNVVRTGHASGHAPRPAKPTPTPRPSSARKNAPKPHPGSGPRSTRAGAQASTRAVTGGVVGSGPGSGAGTGAKAKPGTAEALAVDPVTQYLNAYMKVARGNAEGAQQSNAAATAAANDAIQGIAGESQAATADQIKLAQQAQPNAHGIGEASNIAASIANSTVGGGNASDTVHALLSGQSQGQFFDRARALNVAGDADFARRQNGKLAETMAGLPMQEYDLRQKQSAMDAAFGKDAFDQQMKLMNYQLGAQKASDANARTQAQIDAGNTRTAAQIEAANQRAATGEAGVSGRARNDKINSIYSSLIHVNKNGQTVYSPNPWRTAYARLTSVGIAPGKAALLASNWTGPLTGNPTFRPGHEAGVHQMLASRGVPAARINEIMSRYYGANWQRAVKGQGGTGHVADQLQAIHSLFGPAS